MTATPHGGQLTNRQILEIAEGISGVKMTPGALSELRRRALNGDREAMDRVLVAWLGEHAIQVGEDPDTEQPVTYVEDFGSGASDSKWLAAVRASIPPTSIARRAVKQLLYDAEYIPNVYAGGTLQTQFFMNPHAFSHANAPRSKSKADCNLYGQGGSIPQGHRAHLFRLGFLLDAGADEKDAQDLWNLGEVSLEIGYSEHTSWPMRALMPPPKEIPTGEIGLYEAVYPLDHGVSLVVGDKPITLEPLEAFRLRLTGPTPVQKTIRLMAIFYAVVERPLIG